MYKRLALAVIALIAMGCSHPYSEKRPSVTDLDPRDRGLQSKDVVAATDQLAQALLALPEMNASKEQWTVVVDRVENHSSDPGFNYDIFLARLRVNLAKYGHGRIALIENKAKLHELQARELEANAPAPAGTQPDYALYGKVYELPNRGTSYYMADFSLTDMRTRRLVWSDGYEVKVER